MSAFKEDMADICSVIEAQYTFRFRFDESIAPKSVDIVGYSARAQNVLKRNGLFKIGDVLDRWGDFKKFNGCGEAANKEIKMKLLEWYYDQLTPSKKKEFWEAFVHDNGIKELEVIR